MSSSQPLQDPHESNSSWIQMQYITPKHNKYNTGCKTLKRPSESLTDSQSATRGVLPLLGNTEAWFPAKWKPRFLATYAIQIHFLTALTRKDASSIPYGTGTTNCDEFPSWYTVGLTSAAYPKRVSWCVQLNTMWQPARVYFTAVRNDVYAVADVYGNTSFNHSCVNNAGRLLPFKHLTSNGQANNHYAWKVILKFTEPFLCIICININPGYDKSARYKSKIYNYSTSIININTDLPQMSQKYIIT
jgi:hypothetical protein